MHEKNRGNDFLDVTKLNLMERLKWTEEKRKKRKSEKSESPMGIKLMTF